MEESKIFKKSLAKIVKDINKCFDEGYSGCDILLNSNKIAHENHNAIDYEKIYKTVRNKFTNCYFKLIYEHDDVHLCVEDPVLVEKAKIRLVNN